VGIDQQLWRIFLGLSQLLISQGYSHARLSKLMKFAFIDAAKPLSSKGKTTSHIARIAILTGLTRLEVSRVLKLQHSIGVGDEQLNRATRVAKGWMNDRNFIDARRKPRALKFSAKQGEFQALVKKYSGDIPARAMLSEMSRLEMVRQAQDGHITLLRTKPKVAQITRSAIQAIAPWVDLIADAGDRPNTLSSQTQKLAIRFNSLSEVMAATRELDSRWLSFVASIRQMGTRAKRGGGFDVTVSSAIAIAKPTRHHRHTR